MRLWVVGLLLGLAALARAGEDREARRRAWDEKVQVVEVLGRTTRAALVGELGQTTTTVTFGAGSAEGVWEGMEFVVESPEGVWATVRTIRVLEHSSEAEVQQLHLGGEEPPPPAVGWVLTTRLGPRR